MSDWECGVCGYIHKESEAPEKCPICEAPQVMFAEQVTEEEQVDKLENDEQVETVVPVESVDNEIKQWRCTVSGYLHTGVNPPEKCPICEATAEDFELVVEKELDTIETAQEVERRWRCTVCGYIHTGEEPPDSCPVCAAPKNLFVEIDAAGKTIGEIAQEPVMPLEAGETQEKSFLNSLGNLILKFHLHPITAHFPNGILPVVLLFLGIAVFFQIAVLEQAAFYNLIFVLAMLPVVLLTGFVEWQKRYRGAKTALFIIKIICALIVIASVNVLVFWRLIDPQVLAAGAPSQPIYLGVAAVMLAAAGIAGHLGGKLVHAGRG